MVLVRGLSSFLSLASPGVQERLRTVWTAEIFEAGPPGLQTNKYHFKIAKMAKKINIYKNLQMAKNYKTDQNFKLLFYLKTEPKTNTDSTTSTSRGFLERYFQRHFLRRERDEVRLRLVEIHP